jgi:sRNA-binding carbon storage regulator CsrA
VRVLSIRPGSVKLGIEAADDVEILRGELIEPSADTIEMADLAEV